MRRRRDDVPARRSGRRKHRAARRAVCRAIPAERPPIKGAAIDAARPLGTPSAAGPLTPSRRKETPMSIAPTATGARFREARQNTGLSQTMLARICDVTPATIRSLERGDWTRCPRLDRIVRIVQVLGVSADWIYAPLLHDREPDPWKLCNALQSSSSVPNRSAVRKSQAPTLLRRATTPRHVEAATAAVVVALRPESPSPRTTRRSPEADPVRGPSAWVGPVIPRIRRAGVAARPRSGRAWST